MKFTEQDKIGWETGQYDELNNDEDKCDTYNIVAYYPELDVTVWLHCFFDGHYNHRWVEEFCNITKGRAEWNKVVKYLTRYTDNDKKDSTGLDLSSIINI